MSKRATETIARVCSNVLEEGQLDRPRKHTSNTEGHYVVTVEAVTSILAALSRSAAADLVSNQDAMTIETPAFSMQVARIDTNSRSTAKTGVRAVEELPAELPADIELQTITWQKNPFAPFAPDVPVENPAMLVSSRVITVNLYSSGHLLNVSDLDDAINITLSTAGIENNLTDNEATCNSTACMDRYNIAQDNLHACSDLLSLGRTAVVNISVNHVHTLDTVTKPVELVLVPTAVPQMKLTTVVRASSQPGRLVAIWTPRSADGE